MSPTKKYDAVATPAPRGRCCFWGQLTRSDASDPAQPRPGGAEGIHTGTGAGVGIPGALAPGSIEIDAMAFGAGGTLTTTMPAVAASRCCWILSGIDRNATSSPCRNVGGAGVYPAFRRCETCPSSRIASPITSPTVDRACPFFCFIVEPWRLYVSTCANWYPMTPEYPFFRSCLIKCGRSLRSIVTDYYIAPKGTMCGQGSPGLTKGVPPLDPVPSAPNTG